MRVRTFWATTWLPALVAWVWSACIMPGTPKTPWRRKGSMGTSVLLGQQGVGGVELVDVVGAVVGRQGDAGEDDPGAARR